MNTFEISQIDEKYYMNTFGKRTNVCFKSGKGMKLVSAEGEEYTDLMAGIAVNALGHSHPKFTEAICDQVKSLIHTSSLYYVENQALLAKKIVENSVADRVFFANSGAEANEGAIKLAKIYNYKKGNPEKNEIITLKNSFHGRTLTTVAATGQVKYQKPYHPLTPGFSHVEINDFDALCSAIGDKTAAIMLELVQGESGVHPADISYIKKLRQLCDEKEIILIVDEIQTGMGRCGSLFAYEKYGIEPDIFTLAKALGGGIPIGAVCAKEKFAKGFEPGDHGTTFGGNPLATRAGLEVFKIFEEEKLVENSEKMGIYFKEKLLELGDKIKEVRGAGLMIGVEFAKEIAKDVQKALFDRKFLTGAIGTSVLRLVPPLIITKEDIDSFVSALKDVLAERK